MSRVYHWHGQFNVYVLKNKDVLLLSPGQQLLLPQAQFPFVDEINGALAVEDILAKKGQLDEKSSLFLYQLNKLQELALISHSDDECDYHQPSLINTPKQYLLKPSTLSRPILIKVYSECSEGLIKSFTTWLEVNADVHALLQNNLPITFALVDDFTDASVLEESEVNIILVKLTGDAISISSVFRSSEFKLLTCLQSQLLENQPVRKMLQRAFPDANHAYPFKLAQVLTHEELSAIYRMLTAQLSSDLTDKKLSIYRKSNASFETHSINLALDNDLVFSDQINSPIRLNACISQFNIDGGSRSISASETVKKLMPLVSPITGVINHLEVIGETPESPIKIYRTGFFKTNNKSTEFEFDRNSFVQICLGKGVSHAQSKASALSESIERYAALYQFDVSLLQSSKSNMLASGKQLYDFQSLVPYSANQYHKFNTSNHPDAALKQAAKPYKDETIHWLPTWSLTQEEQVYVPLSQCFSNIPFSDDEFGRWHSNGCAAGNTLEEAILQALFELIERDATAIWWYNKLVCPKFDLTGLNPENLSKLDQSLSPSPDLGHEYWVLDLTSDLGVPVMGAIGKDKKSGGLVMGFGCHLIPEMAAQRALTELCQLIPIRDQNAAPFDFDEIEEGEYLFGSLLGESNTYAIKPSQDIKEDILSIVAQLKTKNMEVLALNYSRAHIPLFTAKIFVPGLCHIWPQLANERLYQAPYAMGYSGIANTEQSINQQPLYI
ncbi:YcaO-like family protein [Marinomonas sp. MED121]|uniref:YcaO-like family protein n=1 Tax=Marinomonas sp. MED121 TaxID=314277 RepID=UPI001A93C3CF|nr:YcaO-like family protein [Marinomonas sp. MED121]